MTGYIYINGMQSDFWESFSARAEALHGGEGYLGSHVA